MKSNGAPPLENDAENESEWMPQFRTFLDDRAIADVVTFIRAAWGNRAGPVTVEKVREVRRETGLPLLELSVQQSGSENDGLLRDWPVVASGVEKHHGYAFQWFALCALIALLYVWFQIVQPRRKQPRP